MTEWQCLVGIDPNVKCEFMREIPAELGELEEIRRDFSEETIRKLHMDTKPLCGKKLDKEYQELHELDKDCPCVHAIKVENNEKILCIPASMKRINDWIEYINE